MSVTIAYYYGPVVYFGPDGKTPYGQSVSLVKRAVDPTNNQITEIVSQPDRSNPNKANDFETSMVRSGASNSFDVHDAGNTFSGTMLFTGPEWAWNQWDYDLTLTAGGKIKGHGTIDLNGITARKQVLKDDGSVSVLVNESLAPITVEQYLVRRRELFPDGT